MPVIPKEQLAAYQRWQMGSFDEAKTPAATPKPAPAPGGGEPVSGINLPTAEGIERIHNQAQQDGYRAGFDAGHQAGYEQGMASARQQAEHLSLLTNNFSTALAKLDQDVAETILELALAVARQVVQNSLKAQPEAIIAVIREALTALPLHHSNITLHLNPQDAELLRTQLGNQLTQSGWHIMEDSEIQAGGCLVRAGASEVDATVATRWARIVESIGGRPPGAE
ncbi:MAG: flagellar assembly protein FliH [Betaproteobacteria bacterium]